jgi:hypothetical protein
MEDRMTNAEKKELEQLRKYREQTEATLHVIYDLLYFDPGEDAYDSEKEWDSASDYLERIAEEMTQLMGKPKNGTKTWPKIAGLPALRKP